jgi:trehalose 6-phosphate synthase
MATNDSSPGDVFSYPSTLVIAAHRGPVSLSRGVDGEILTGQAAGGLAPSLARALEGSSTIWIACATTPLERELAGNGLGHELVPGVEVRYLAIDEDVIRDAYRRIANETLWFLNHDMGKSAGIVIDERWLGAFANFRIYNQAFADQIASIAQDGATVMVNDYHLPLVGPVLGTLRPDLSTVHFSHTPFANPESLAVLPEQIARELLVAMGSYGACGFHTDRWAQEFIACCDHYEVNPPEVFSCGLGVDAEALLIESTTPSVMDFVARDAKRFGDRKVIFRADRLEPTKNIVNGFLAYERLLERRPDLIESTVFYARSYLSRTDLPLYLHYRKEVEQTVASINSRFGSTTRRAIEFEIDDHYDASLAAYREYDVLIVNPILDGMNLIAKEAPVVNVSNGVVVLSTGAGSYELLAGSVIGIDPLDVEATASALERGLTIPLEERSAHSAQLKVLGAKNPPAVWLAKVLTHAERGTPS